jgi:formate dehydrogenase major subunit
MAAVRIVPGASGLAVGVAEAVPEVQILLDGTEVSAKAGRTILEVCRDSGIDIPTLCDDPQLRPHGSCGMCVVEVEGYGLVTSCTTRVADGMTVETGNEKVVSARKQRLDALLYDHFGDCVAPCQLACPAGIDVQGYLALIARGAYSEAVQLIKEKLPLPRVIGRICPHKCEDACRRNLVDKPVAICSSKRFAGDQDQLSEHKYRPVPAPKTGHRVAIVGGGPAGLSAGYYLALEGHDVKIFEALPKPGGMLRYGIPDYRLPQDVLDDEIANITDLGVVIETNRALGKDFTTEDLFKQGYGAVLLSIGAHQSTKMSIEGEDLPGVIAGISMLRAAASGEKVEIGRRVAVVGGGNTAIDAARTAVRLGATEVTIVYRRSRDEMPASNWEIEEAEEEGVKLQFLAAPIRVVEQAGKVAGLECIRMALGAPDSSGRRRPEPVPDSEFVIQLETVIAAIGQRTDNAPLRAESDLRTERNGAIAVDSATFMTELRGVFGGGDCITGPVTAVEGIASGRKAALSIDCYLRGVPLPKGKPTFNISKGKLKELAGRPEFTELMKKPREAMPKHSVEESIGSFQEIELGFEEDAARKEAQRCLECGCKADYYCDLRRLATDHEIQPPAFREHRDLYPKDLSHPFIERDANKCIACARCARVCGDVQGVGALGFAYRVSTNEGPGGSLLNTTCESCGQCVASCPVGALVAKNELRPEHEVKTVCSFCGVGCSIFLGVRGDKIVSLRGDPESPVNHGNLCVKGRFGYEFVQSPERLTSPLIKRGGVFEKASWEEALDLVASKLSGYRGEQFAVVSSAKCTNEENYLFQKFARGVMGTNNLDHCART